MAGHVRVELTMTVLTADAVEFERSWSRVGAWTRRQPGCLRQSLCRSDEDAAGESTFHITSDWVDAESFHRFEKSGEQDEMTSPLRALRRSVHMRLTSLVSHLDREPAT